MRRKMRPCPTLSREDETWGDLRSSRVLPFARCFSAHWRQLSSQHAQSHGVLLNGNDGQFDDQRPGASTDGHHEPRGAKLGHAHRAGPDCTVTTPCICPRRWCGSREQLCRKHLSAGRIARRPVARGASITAGCRMCATAWRQPSHTTRRMASAAYRGGGEARFHTRQSQLAAH